MLCLTVFGLMGSARANPVFNLAFTGGTSPTEQAAFATAANYWASAFDDNVAINLTVGTAALSSGVLAQAASVRSTFSYSSFRSKMLADISSATDTAAVAHLPNTTGVSMYLNYTSNSPNGAGSATPYVDADGDANNTTVRITNANAKALGLTPINSTLLGLCDAFCDGYIQFSTGYSWDLDRSNGISAGAFDFVGLAIHEIGHALGFLSGVDYLDTNSSESPYKADNLLTYVSPLDMFRCSAASASAGTTLDFTAGSGVRNFSLDNCASSLGRFAEGAVHGDGRQASHWKDSLALGIMDPTAAPGELLAVTPLDLIAFDAIGWNLESLEVPEPGTLTFGAAWMLGLLAMRRRSRANGQVRDRA